MPYAFSFSMPDTPHSVKHSEETGLFLHLRVSLQPGKLWFTEFTLLLYNQPWQLPFTHGSFDPSEQGNVLLSPRSHGPLGLAREWLHLNATGLQLKVIETIQSAIQNESWMLECQNTVSNGVPCSSDTTDAQIQTLLGVTEEIWPAEGKRRLASGYSKWFSFL
jgi:hypothetical protein